MGEADKQATTDTAQTEDGPQKRRFGSSLGVLSFVVALGGGFFLGQAIQNDEVDWQGYDDHGRYRVHLRGDEPQHGPDDALVTVIEFTDYQCPFCKKAHGPLMEMLDDHDDVRLIVKHHPLPMHPHAIPAARAAWAAHQQGKFWPMHDHLFEVEGSLDGIDDAATAMGIDVDRFRRDMVSPAAAESVENDRFAASVLGIGSTPHFVVNGRHLRGALSDTHWERVVDYERNDAERIIDEHKIAPGNLYAHLMSTAKGKRDRPQGARPGPDPQKHHAVVAPEGRPSLGPVDAPVTVVEFSDFQCPYCATLAPTIHALPGRHDGNVRVVFLQLPLAGHDQARPAAKAALAAQRQGKFWEMHDALFAAGGELSDAQIVAIADSVGLDRARFDADRQDPALDAMIDEDKALADRFGITGTPASFVNGRYVRGAIPAERFDALIEEELALALPLIEAGTPASQVAAQLAAREPSAAQSQQESAP